MSRSVNIQPSVSVGFMLAQLVSQDEDLIHLGHASQTRPSYLPTPNGWTSCHKLKPIDFDCGPALQVNLWVILFQDFDLIWRYHS